MALRSSVAHGRAAGVPHLSECRFEGLNFVTAHHPGTAGIFRQCCLGHSDVDRVSVLYSLYAVYDRNNCYVNKIEHVTGTLSGISRYGVACCLAANDLQINHCELRGSAHQIALASGAEVRVDTAYMINPRVTSLCVQECGVSVSNFHASSEANPTRILASVVGGGNPYEGLRFSDCEFDSATGFGAPAVIVDGGAAGHFERCYFGSDLKAEAEIQVKRRPWNGIAIAMCTQLGSGDKYPEEAGHMPAKPFADAMDFVTVTDSSGVLVGGARVVGHQQDYIADLPAVADGATTGQIIATVNRLLTAMRAGGSIAPTDFDPTTIDGLAADFRDDRGVTWDPELPPTPRHRVSEWRDQKSALVVQATDDSRPLYFTHAGPGGSPLMVGNGSTILTCSSNIVPTGSPRTVIVLARPDTAAAGALLTCKTDSIRSRFGLAPWPAPTGPSYWLDGTGRFAWTDGPGVVAGAWHVFVYTFQVDAIPLLRIDGRYVVDRPQVAPIPDTGRDGFALMGDPADEGQGWTGALKRLVVYSRILALPEIQACERALMRQLGIHDTRHG